MGPGVISWAPSTWTSSTPEKNCDSDATIITRNIMERSLDPAPIIDVEYDEVQDVSRVPPKSEYEHLDQKRHGVADSALRFDAC
jgi:hypothetical protein